MTKVKREKSFVVHWISFKCWENIPGYCFICMESAAIAQSINRENLRFIKNPQKSQQNQEHYLHL